MVLRSSQHVPWQQNDGEINSSSLNACQAASEVMILDKFVDAAVKAHRKTKKLRQQLRGIAMRDIIQRVSRAAKPRKQNLKDASVHVCVAVGQQQVLSTVVFFPFHRLFICMYLLVLY